MRMSGRRRVAAQVALPFPQGFQPSLFVRPFPDPLSTPVVDKFIQRSRLSYGLCNRVEGRAEWAIALLLRSLLID